MNTFDIVIIITLCVSIAIGLWKGLTKQVLSLAGVIIGTILGFNYYSLLASHFPQIDPNISNIMAFSIIFFGSMIIAMILNWIIGNFFDAIGLASLDKIGGGFIGFAKGWIIAAVFCFVLVAVLPINHSLLLHSYCLPYILKSTTIVKEIVPDDLLLKYEVKFKMLQAGRISEATLAKSKELLKNK